MPAQANNASAPLLTRSPVALWRSRAAAKNRRSLLLLLVAAVGWMIGVLRPDAGNAAERSDLNAADILRTVREAQSVKHQTLAGQLRTDRGTVFPFLLVSDGPRIQYRFQPPAPPAVFQVQINDENSQLQEVGSGEKLSPLNFDKKVLDTDLSYEDLALRFLYWSRAQIAGEETVKTRAAWKLRLDAPSRRSEYSSVNLWIDKDSGALLKAEGYGPGGDLLKRFDVISAQKIEGAWYLKQMRIETLEAGSGKVRSRTYLEVKGLAK